MIPTNTYTYQGGSRLDLLLETTCFISRSKEEDLIRAGFKPVRRISPHSWRVETDEARLQSDIERARRLGPAYPDYIVASTSSRFRVTDRLFLRFRHETHEKDAHQLAARFGLSVDERLSPRDYLLRVPSTYDVIDIVRAMTEREFAEVELVDHDLNIRPHLHEVMPDDPDLAKQWEILAKINNEQLIRSCALLDCPGAWTANGYGDPDVVVGVVDSGCNLSDPNFAPGKFPNWAVLLDGALSSKGDFTNPDSGAIMNSVQLHGTLCATIIAASANHFGGVGVAPNCSLLPVKWQDLEGATTFPESLFSKVVGFLRDKVDVVSSSWNRGTNGYWTPHFLDCLRDAARNGGRLGNGIVWIWSAGNRNCPIHHMADIPVPVTVAGDGDILEVRESSKQFTNELVGIPGIVHVGAISSLGRRCHYSNYGTGLDLVAPSGNRHLYGRDAAEGEEVLAPLANRGLLPFRGTSASAPLVAGVAALVRSANPRLRSEEVVSVLQRTADRGLDMTGYDPSSRPTDPDPAWDVSPIAPFKSGTFGPIGHPDGTWSPWFGFGKVNARLAVEEALRS